MKRVLGLLLAGALLQPLLAQTNSYPFMVISKVQEANPRVVALSIDAGQALPINWKLDTAFSVNAELMPVMSYAGDPIANSAAPKSPRTIKKAYTSSKPEIGSPSQGRYVIIEMDPHDFNASSWYSGFNPGIRQMIPYKEKMVYEVKLLQDLHFLAPDPTPKTPASTVQTLKTNTVFTQAGSKLVTADDFIQQAFSIPENTNIKAISYNFYKPSGVESGAKVPLVVFLHGSGQSHDYVNFPNDLRADTLSPLLANQGGVTWVERGPEKPFVLVPQVPERDKLDDAGEAGWRGADTQRLLLRLVDKVVADNPAIDINRLYLAGLSLGGMGAWKIITDPNPAVSRKFAAAVILNSSPANFYGNAPNEDDSAKGARILAETDSLDYRHVAIPLWLGHSNTDPLVNPAGARIPFTKITGQATVEGKTGGLSPAAGVMKAHSPLLRYYEAANRVSGTEVRYTEYQFNQGNTFLDLGMMTRHAHFTWEVDFKDQQMIDWTFTQTRRPTN